MLRNRGCEYVKAESANVWTRNYVESLGIGVQQVSSLNELWGVNTPTEFKLSRCEELCGLDLSTLDHLYAALDRTFTDDMLDSFLRHLYDVYDLESEQYYSSPDFGKALLTVTGIYRLRHLSIKGPLSDLTMIMAGEQIVANPDICIEIKRSRILAVVQTEKNCEPEGHIAAEMVAAFNRNFERGLVSSQRMYGISIYGTFCAFYRLDIDEVILDSIQSGYKYASDEPRLTTLCMFAVGERSTDFLIRSKDNMRETLLVFEAFQKLLELET